MDTSIYKWPTKEQFNQQGENWNIFRMKYQMTSDSFCSKMLGFRRRFQKDTAVYAAFSILSETSNVKNFPHLMGSKNIRNLTFNSEGQMTYTPIGKDPTLTYKIADDSLVWSKKGRQSGKYGRLYRKLLTQIFSDKRYTDSLNMCLFISLDDDLKGKILSDATIEKMANVTKAYYTVTGDWEIVEGSDIVYYYNEEQYDRECNLGTLGGSCMRYEDCHCPEALEFYANNSDTVKMLILKHPDKDLIRGRALVWHHPDGNIYMDRIYGNDAVQNSFMTFALEKKWFRKEKQDSASPILWVNPEGERETLHLSMPMTWHDYFYPYGDTFHWCDQKSFIANHKSAGSKINTQIEPDCQNWDYMNWSEYHQEMIHEDESYYVESENDYFYSDEVQRTVYRTYELESKLTYLNPDNASSGYYFIDDENVVIVHANGDYAHINDVFLCKHSDNYYFWHEMSSEFEDVAGEVEDEYRDALAAKMVNEMETIESNEN